YTKGDKQEIIDELKAVIERERIDYLNSGLSNKEISKSDYDDLVKSVWSGFDAGLEAIQKETKLLNSNTIKDASFAKFNEVKIANVPKHIVIVTKEFPPFTRSGGIGTLYYNLASELLLAGHFVTIIMQSDKVETIENGRFRLIALTKDVGSETYIDDSLIANEILNWSKRIAIEIDALNEIHPVSVVDSCLWDSEAYAFSLINKELNIPLVIRLVTPFL
ncbi:TPA: glycogen/starch synthase, partial [Escherichia coli]|nr:glycogen/starch synthase [Escherichia coli]